MPAKVVLAALPWLSIGGAVGGFAPVGSTPPSSLVAAFSAGDGRATAKATEAPASSTAEPSATISTVTVQKVTSDNHER
jgi:hypothetical protein